MADIRSKGTLTKWLDDKGFGFITPDKDRKEIFIHISAFGSSLPRRPKGGDTIFFYIKKDENGKTKAVDAIIEGAAPVERKSIPQQRRSYSKGSTRKGSRILSFVIILVIVIGATAYNQFFSGRGSFTTGFSKSTMQTSARFTCAGKTRCTEMTSCEEATFYLQNCPGTLMDGDGDGIPCERQHCN